MIMLFISMTFWLLAIVFAAYAILRLWSGLVAPKVINALLLPGTVVAQIGHITGVLLTLNRISSLGDFTASDFGKILLAKIMLFASMLMLAFIAVTLLHKRMADRMSDPGPAECFDFETDEGHFGWSLTYSGSNQGILAGSTAERVTDEAE